MISKDDIGFVVGIVSIILALYSIYDTHRAEKRNSALFDKTQATLNKIEMTTISIDSTTKGTQDKQLSLIEKLSHSNSEMLGKAIESMAKKEKKDE